jgi:BTB/POZ domain
MASSLMEYSCVSKCGISKLTYEWTIEDFSTKFLTENLTSGTTPNASSRSPILINSRIASTVPISETTSTSSFFSPHFKLSDNASTVWRLEMFTEKLHSLYIEIRLVNYSGLSRQAKLQSEVTVLNPNGGEIFYKTPSMTEINIDASFERRRIMNKGFDMEVFKNIDKLSFLVHFTLHQFDHAVTLKEMRMTAPSVVSVPNANGFGCILGDKDFSDVTFIAGDKEIPAHKALLAAKSPAFAAIFKSEEDQTNRITIAEKASVFEELLRFIYAGEVKKLEINAEGLLPIADKYGIDQLKSLCELELIDQLNASNALQRLVLADLHGASHLKCEAIQVINSNASEVTQTEEWKALIESKPHLLAEIYSKSMNV